MVIFAEAQIMRPRYGFADDSEAKGDSSDHLSEQDSVKSVGSCAESDYDCGELLT